HTHEPPKSRTIPACAGEPDKLRAKIDSFKDYPRVCGGTLKSQEAFFLPKGLSPRVRGNRSTSQTISPEWRTIPACAGEPSSLALSCSALEDYPRVCGGTELSNGIGDRGAGLSPRVRGNL